MGVSTTQAASVYQAPPAQLLAGKTPVAELEAAAAPAANPGADIFQAMKADLESQGPVGGSRSYKTRDGRIVILGNQRELLPKTGIKTVDKISKEMAPAVDNTREMVEDVYTSTKRAAISGGVTGALIGLLLRYPLLAAPKANFVKIAAGVSLFGIVGALLSAAMEGYKAVRKNSRKVTSSAVDAMQGIVRKSSSPEAK